MKTIKTTPIAAVLREPDKFTGREVDVKGWVRTRRGNKNVQFVALNDGSTIKNLQIVFDLTRFSDDDLKAIATGASIHVQGELVASQGKGQSVEVQASELEVYGTADPEKYPLQKKGHSLEFLREIAHLRPRTNTFGAVLRIRHALAFAVHKFFNDKGFYYFHTPLITASDCEGAGAMFQVTTLDMENPPRTEDGKVDYSQDFFGRHASLTVSGQLEGELGATALGCIYTFGPTFRAENSNTPRHLSEFWMIEPEMAFADLSDNMDVIEDMIKYCINYVLEHAPEEMEFFEKVIDKECINRIKHVAGSDFKRMTYTEAIEELKKAADQFENKDIFWGMDLQSEHERYICEKVVQGPVFLTDYPKDIKAFYMRENEDGKTVAACDLLVPYVGELVGGSQREERYDVLEQKMKDMGMELEPLQWYLDLRRFGGCKHSGFGLGFDRMLMYLSGVQNIRDVQPYPRTPRNLIF